MLLWGFGGIVYSLVLSIHSCGQDWNRKLNQNRVCYKYEETMLHSVEFPADVVSDSAAKGFHFSWPWREEHREMRRWSEGKFEQYEEVRQMS